MIAVDTVQAIPITLLDPHPDNPRLIVREEVLTALVESMKARGFDAAYALLVRPLDGRYQIVSGHTRRMAAEQAGVDSLPCWVREMTDEEAFLELVRANNQGELSPLEIGMHALRAVELSVGGAGNEGGLSAYAGSIGRSQGYVSQVRAAAKVISRLMGFNVANLLKKSQHLYSISRAPETDWQWLVELLIERDWSVKATEAAVGAVLQLGDIPNVLASWLNPDRYKRDAAMEAAKDKDGKSPTAKSVASWVKAASEQLQLFPETREVWRITQDNAKTETLRMRDEFVTRLSAIHGTPSVKRIEECAIKLRQEVADLDQSYKRWCDARKDAEERRRQQEEQERETLERRLKFRPSNFNADIREVNLSEYTFDAIITDPPYLLSNDGQTVRGGQVVSMNKNFEDDKESAISPEEWVPIVHKCLKPGGVLVATCTDHIYFDLLDVCRELGMIINRGQSIWVKPNAPPNLNANLPHANFEYIFIAYKPGEDICFNYEEYRQIYGEQPPRAFTIAQCGGNERLGWHDTQKPLELAEKLIALYVPKFGRFLDPFAGSGTFSVAAKRLGRRSVWVEKDADFYTRIENRLDETPFHWEL